MADELSEYQKHKKKISKEVSEANLSIIPNSVTYEVLGNKIRKVFKKTNGGTYTLFVGNVRVRERVNDRFTGREVFTQTYQNLVKKGLLPDVHRMNKKGV